MSGVFALCLLGIAVLLALAIVIVAQLAFTYAPFMNALFDSAPLGLADGALIIAIGFASMVILELEKMIGRRRAASR